MTKILFVEDNADLRQTYAEVIEVLGYDCLLAKNGQDALAIIQSTECDLILLDIEMPYMNGYEFMRYIKADPQRSHLPVALFTAKDQESLRLELHDVEPNAILPKPVDIKQLRTTLEHLLNSELVKGI